VCIASGKAMRLIIAGMHRAEKNLPQAMRFTTGR